MHLRRTLLLVSVVSVSVVQLGRAADTPCTVTQDAEGTHYSVPEFRGKNCNFQWRNGTDHVVANPKGHSEQVAGSDIRTLNTSKCFPRMVYTRTCDSGAKEEATCSFDCSVKPAAPKGRAAGWMTGGNIAAVVLVPVLVLLVLLVLVCYKCRASLNGFCRRKRGSVQNESSESLQKEEA